MNSCLENDGCVEKKARCTKKCVIEQEIKYEEYKEHLENKKTILSHNKRPEMSCIMYSKKR